MKQDDFLKKLFASEKKEDVLETIALVYPQSAESSEVFYHASGIEDLGWESFYALRDMEDIYGIGCFASAYIATVLALPKISSYYSEISGAAIQEKSDFCGRVLDMTATKLIPEWDKDKNDNFFAYMLPNLLTVRNAILAEDGGPSKYLRTKKGLSLVSIEGMKERSEAGASWDTPDTERNTEEEAFARIRRGKMSLLRRVVGLTSEESLPNSDNIWNSIVCRKLFHSQDEDELSMLDDAEISSSLTEYFDKKGSRTRFSMEESEAEMCLV